jgi:hypothetical protein
MGRALAVWDGDGTQALNGSALSSPSNATNHATAADCSSLGVFPHRPADLHGLRRRLPGEWSAFLKLHFQSATHVAAFFDVDHRTARNWLAGSHGVNAAPLLLLIRENEVARQFFLGEAA